MNIIQKILYILKQKTMKIFKNDVEKYLNSFEWEFREIFFEKSKSFRFVNLNWNFKTPTFSTLEWFSVLSRTWNEEYFKVFSWFQDISEKINSFKGEYSLSNSSNTTNLKWEEYLELTDLEELNFDLNNIIESTNDLYKEMLLANKLITSSEISILLSRKAFIVWNTSWNFKSDINFYNTYFIKLIWEKNWNREEIFEKITWTDILEKFEKENFKKYLENAIKTLEKQLNWEKSPSGKIDVIIWNEAGWTIIHEAVWHWLEADLQNSSVYKDRIWEKVASELVTIVDNPTTVWERWHYKNDHEWNIAQNTTLIENWILKSYLHNEKTSKKFWVSSTSHWRKETYKHKTLVRMWNTYMLPWKDKKEDLIKKIVHWVYISRMWGWQVNTATWDFVFKVQNGYLIENWVLTKNIIWATLSWNWPEMLNEIYWICDDLNFFDWGTCWKWQSMPVSDGVPTFWTKLKVSA